MKVGDKVRTTYQHSETATIVKPRKREGVPGSGWHIIQWDCDGKRACCHEDMMVLRND